jgi:hypothetical protein
MGYISHIELPDGTTYDIQDKQPAVLDIPNTPASIATFSGAANLPLSSLKVAIEPQQDLHGYDAPWAGGAGKNKLPMTVDGIKATNTYHSWSGNSTTINNVTITIETDSVGNVTGIRFNGTASADITFNLASNITISNGSYVWSNDQIVNISNLWMSLTSPNLAITLSSEKEKNVTVSNGSIGSAYIYASSGNAFNNVVFKPMLRPASVTDATFAPYSNICPIIGWDEANVTRTGKNLFDIHIDKDTALTTIDLDKPITTYITISAVNNNVLVRDAVWRVGVKLKSGQMYYVGDPTYVYKFPRTLYGTEENPIVQIQYRGQTITSGSYDVQIEFGQTPTTYEPYNGATYTIDLDGTRYGGTLDVVSGELVVDRVYIDMGSPIWRYTNNRFYYNPTNAKVYTLIEVANLLCSQYPNSQYNSQADNTISGYAGYIYVRADSYSGDTTAFKTAMNGVQLVYELATPITVQLTPTQVKSLLGSNNIFADCGQITECKYVVSKYDGMTAKISEVAYSATNATSATTASKLGSSNVGSATQPIYLSAGTATACTYTLGKSVPSDAVFTDTQANWAQTTATALDYIKNKPTFGTAFTLDGTTINHSKYGSSGTAGTSSATHGATLAVPYITTNAQGHVTGKGTHTHTVEGLQYHTANISRVVMMSDGQVSVQTKGYLSCNNYDNTGFKPMTASAFNVSSSRKVKENIEPIADEEAYKLLDVTPVSFDYISEIGGAKNQFGVIAEEVNDILPFVVSIPEDYKEDDGNYMNVPSVDYSKFIPHLIKLVQIQEQKINDLQQEIFELKNK